MVVEAVTNFQISSVLSKELNKNVKARHLNNVWKKADFKGNLKLYKTGFLWDHWANYFLIAYPTHIIYFKNTKTERPSGFIPLFK